MVTEVASAVLEGLEVGALVGKINAAKEQEQAEQTAIRDRMTQERIAGAQKATARDEAIQNLVGHQMAVEAVSGFDLDSPSFTAITTDDFNKFSQNRSNDALDLNLKENQLQQDMAQTKIATNASIWGDVIGTATSLFSQSGLSTNLADADKGDTTKMVTPSGKSDFDGETSNAQKRRQKSPGLFDGIE